MVPIRTLSPPDSRSEDKNEGVQHFPWYIFRLHEAYILHKLPRKGHPRKGLCVVRDTYYSLHITYIYIHKCTCPDVLRSDLTRLGPLIVALPVGGLEEFRPFQLGATVVLLSGPLCPVVAATYIKQYFIIVVLKQKVNGFLSEAKFGTTFGQGDISAPALLTRK